MNRRDYNPLNDYLFKFVFGKEERKRITLSFLNAILERESVDELTDITFIDRALDPTFEEDKLSQLDIYGITSDGSQINIEVQVMNRHNMQKRTLYYWARMYQTLRRGKEYHDLSRSITINLLNFHLLPQENPHNMYGLYDIESGHRLTDDLEIHFLEIPKFKIKSIKEMKRLEKLLAYFSNKLDERETEELAMSESAISEAIQAEQIFMWNAGNMSNGRRHCVTISVKFVLRAPRDTPRDVWREQQKRHCIIFAVLCMNSPFRPTGRWTFSIFPPQTGRTICSCSVIKPANRKH